MSCDVHIYYSSQFHCPARASDGSLIEGTKFDESRLSMIAEGSVQCNGAHKFESEVLDLDSGLDAALVRFGDNSTHYLDSRSEDLKAYPASDVYRCLLQAYKAHIGIAHRKEMHHGFAMVKGVLETLMATAYHEDPYVIMWWS